MVPRQHQWNQRMEQLFEPDSTRTKLGFNIHDATKEKRQWGGTAVMSMGKLRHYTMGAGVDKSGLGRWTWARYKGKGEVVLRLVSIYNPVPNKKDMNSVWSQHKAVLQSKNDDRCPRTAFYEDLKTELTQWYEAGDQIVIGGDVNESITHQDITNLFNIGGIRNVIFERHDITHAPTTYSRTRSNRIVDSIWATPGITVDKAGYLEPEELRSNHSLLWIDVSYQSALGHNPPNPVTPSGRKLQLRYTKVVEKYLSEYEALIRKHKLCERQFSLEATATYGQPLSIAQQAEAEAIDVLRTRCMLKAEDKCRKLRMGQVDFSPEVAQSLKEIDFWDIAIRRRTRAQHGHSTVSTRLWRRKKKAAKITVKTHTLTLEEMVKARTAAVDQYKTHKKAHENLRKTFIKTLPAKDRDRLLRTEEQRRLGRCAKLVTGKLESKSVNRIEFEGEEYTTKQDIERIFIQVNGEKTRASDDTMFLQEPYFSTFGPRNDTGAGEQVLAGHFVPLPDTSTAGQILLRGLQRPLTTDTFQPRRVISTEDHIQGFKKAKERTSAGMSRLHFGMFKAHIKRRNLADMDASMRSLSYTTGYVYQRWKQGIDVQLLKRAQQWCARKMRTIFLMEADLNMNHKMMGADAMKFGERNKIWARDNYGGRKGMQAIEVNLNSQLTFNSIWGRRGRAIIMSNDAKGCYDRIAHVVVDLALQRLGIPKPALRAMLQTIQEMDRYIRTAFGDSETSYGNEGDLPPQGVLQGNGAGPAGWSAISTVLIKALQEAGYGYKQWSLIRQRALAITCFAFVDDTDIIHSNQNPDTPIATLLQEAQTALTLWEGLLRATGGALAPEKSYWYLVDVIYQNGKWEYAKVRDTPGNLTLQNGTFNIQRKEVTQSQEALGIQTRPDGDMTDERDYLKGRVTKWCEAIRTKKLTGREAWYCLTCTISKTIEYALVATSFTRQDVDTIMQPLLKTALRLSGVQRNMPRKLVYGPVAQRGLGLKDPYVLQLAYHLTTILKHQHRDTPTQELINENMEIVQYYVGSDQNFWDLPFEAYGHLAPTGWIKSTWQGLSESRLTLKGEDIAIPAQRQHDVHLMDAAVHVNLDQDAQQIIQKCRFYLNATTLADVTTANGKQIDLHCWRGQRSPSRMSTTGIRTVNPTPKEWDAWRHFLTQCFLSPHTTTRKLHTPLGRWTRHIDTQWIWYLHASGEVLYEQQRSEDNQTQWHRWEKDDTALGRSQFSYAGTNDTPINVKRVSVAYTTDSDRANPQIVLNIGDYEAPQAPHLTTLTEDIQNLPPGAKWAVQHLTGSEIEPDIIAAIQDGTLVAVSDGSLKANFGTSAFTLVTPADLQMRGVNVVPGPVKDGDSHRCELAGLYGIVTLVDTICKKHNITIGKITVACDNKQSIGIFAPDFQPHPRHANHDLSAATHHKMKMSALQWEGVHVKGHQDSKSKKPLTRLEQLNVQMDSLAKAYWHHIMEHSGPEMPISPCIAIDGEGWQVWEGTEKICQPKTYDLYDRMQGPPTISWFRRHKIVKAAAIPLIDWHSTAAFMQKSQHATRTWITKHASSNCGVGTTLVNWNFQATAECPRCDCTQEDTTHVLRCQGADNYTVFRKHMHVLRTTLKDLKTDPNIRHTLLRCMRKWRNREAIQFSTIPDYLHNAVRAQTKIGWKNLFEGLMATQWKTAQHRYYGRQSSRQTGRKWAPTVLKKIVAIGRAQWLHRNDCKHNLIQKESKRMERKLDQDIIRELTKGTADLLPGDRARFTINLIHLLDKPLRTKKAWWNNINKARERSERIRRQDAEWKYESQAKSRLCAWMEKRDKANSAVGIPS